MKQLLFSVAIAVTFTASANADVIFDIVETNSGDVEVTLSGSLNLDATFGIEGFASLDTPFYLPSFGLVSVGNDQSVFAIIDAAGFTPFGSGGFDSWDVTSGDRVALFTNPAISVPVGYVSGDALSGSGTKFGATFASLGMTEGEFVTTFTNGNNTDSVRVRVGVVPEPGSFAVILAAGIATLSRRRR